jgi:hypothetical protein
MAAQTLSLISIFIAFCAVAVAVWQARRIVKQAEHTRSLPIISEAFREWRSAEFRRHKDVLLTLDGTTPPDGGFDALPADIQESAYIWCYFCEYLGQLMLYEIIPEEMIIGFAGTQILQLWGVLEPFIQNEREHRLQSLPPGIPPGFLAQYEHLVARIVERGGSRAAEDIRRKHSARTLTSGGLASITSVKSQPSMPKVCLPDAAALPVRESDIEQQDPLVP